MNDLVIELRDEQPGDYGAIREVHLRAFGGETEANLVELLRNRKKAPVALVAVSGDRILGHIMFSPSERYRVLVICYAEVEDRTRIISVRQATRSERKHYEEK